MKDLYINVINRFRFLPSEIRSFTYNQSNVELAARLQKAFSYYKQMSRCYELTFMQFYSNLEKVCMKYGQSLNSGFGGKKQTRPFIFIGAYNMNIMLIKQNGMSNLLMTQSNDSYSALEAFNGNMRSLGLKLERNNCLAFKGQYFVNQGGMTVNCGIYVYPFSDKEYEKIKGRREVDFKYLYDPFVMYCPMITTALTNFIVKALQSRSMKTREKAKSLPEKLESETTDEEKDDGLNHTLKNRLIDFEKSLDALLSEHNIPVE